MIPDLRGWNYNGMLHWVITEIYDGHFKRTVSFWLIIEFPFS